MELGQAQNPYVVPPLALLPDSARPRLSYPKPDTKGIPLREVIALHRRFPGANVLANSLGDGFLYATNPIFRNVRDEYLRRGFRFTTKDFCHYFELPMLSLDELVREGMIPYHENFVWFETLEKRAPKEFTLPEVQSCGLKFNFVLHESAHLIAHSELFGRRPMERLPKTPETLLQILIGESFANAVECLSGIFHVGGLGGYFLQANCYFLPTADDIRKMRDFAQSHGYDAVARLLIGGFLYSNFLYEYLGKKELEQIFAFAGFGAGDQAATELAHVSFRLNRMFRTNTTSYHLRKLGFGTDLGKMLRFDPLARLLRPGSAKIRAKAERLSRIF